MKQRKIVLTGLVMVVSLWLGPVAHAQSPVQPQTASGQQGCTGQACANLQSPQTSPLQANPGGALPTPLQPAARGLSPQDGFPLQATTDGLEVGGTPQPPAPANDPGSLALAILFLLGGGLLLLYVLDKMYFDSRLLKVVSAARSSKQRGDKHI